MDNRREIMVSIICNTYNHEPYVADAINGFLCQKTSFDYEVLIHDDASSDKTQIIIRDYEKKYPKILKAIYQEENQYSKGINVTNTYQLPRVRGKYIAFCEGDDYWTDPYKLQKQIDYLEKHPEIDICTHCVKKIDSITGRESYISPSTESRVLSTKEVIKGGGGYIGTNSIVYRTNLINHFPKFRTMLPIDYTMQVHGSLRGGMYYFSECMSVYRFMTPYSWTKNNRTDNTKARIANQKWIDMLNQLNNDTNYIYAEEINSLLLTDGVSILNSRDENKKIIAEHKKAFSKQLLTSKIKILLITYCPDLFGFIKHIRKKIRNE